MAAKTKQYQTGDIIYRPPDGSVYKVPETLTSYNIDPSLWAYSTIPPGDNSKVVDIYVVSQGNLQSRETVRQRMWLHDILDDEGIPYLVVIKGYWPARRKYAEDQVIYVKEEHRKKAKRLIKAFMNPENIIHDDIDNEITESNTLNGIPQKKCLSCGDEIDFDYHKCPHCKTRVD